MLSKPAKCLRSGRGANSGGAGSIGAICFRRPARASYMLIVTLSGPTRGCAMSPRNLDKIIGRHSWTAGLRHIHAQLLRHFAASEHPASGTTTQTSHAV